MSFKTLSLLPLPPIISKNPEPPILHTTTKDTASPTSPPTPVTVPITLSSSSDGKSKTKSEPPVTHHPTTTNPVISTSPVLSTFTTSRNHIRPTVVVIHTSEDPEPTPNQPTAGATRNHSKKSFSSYLNTPIVTTNSPMATPYNAYPPVTVLPENSSSTPRLSIGAIVGAIVGSVTGVLIIGVLILCLRRKNRQQPEVRESLIILEEKMSPRWVSPPSQRSKYDYEQRNIPNEFEDELEVPHSKE